jgi:pimeloyl-ACP methyl ester carboxylesterase
VARGAEAIKAATTPGERRPAIRGLEIVEHEFAVPLDHSDPSRGSISVFAREVAEVDGANRPFLLYLQGGPGQESYRPTAQPLFPGWLERALPEFRVLLLDDRGTGLSTPIGPMEGTAPADQAAYLAHFRADSIVADAECIRAELGSPPWSVLGASYGGFCILTYLSLAPGGLREAFISGGLPAVRTAIDDVYGHTYRRIIERNNRYYARYPQDRSRVRDIAAFLDSEAVSLPDGGRLTSRRFRQLGWHLGMSDGAETLHYLLERPVGSSAFAHYVYEALPFGAARSPLYSILHEACHADGFPTRWSAARMQPPDYDDDVTLLSGEHVFPWMFDDCPGLAPLKEAAHLLAEHPWGYLYDPDALAENEVPVSAAIYGEDPYVEATCSQETAAMTRNMHTWTTTEFEHNALRAAGPAMLDHLIALARGE